QTESFSLLIAYLSLSKALQETSQKDFLYCKLFEESESKIIFMLHRQGKAVSLLRWFKEKGLWDNNKKENNTILIKKQGEKELSLEEVWEFIGKNTHFREALIFLVERETQALKLKKAVPAKNFTEILEAIESIGLGFKAQSEKMQRNYPQTLY